MNRLNEQFIKMYGLLYGRDHINKKKNILKKYITEIDDPKKADLVTGNLKDFYDTLESIEEPIFQQKYGSMKYQKAVETVQIGLVLLGYKLPKFGVDGLFGPETADAVNKFRTDFKISDQDTSVISEATLNSPLSSIQITSQYGVQRGDRKHMGVDFKAQSGTEIKSPADGKVVDAGFQENACGGTIKIEHQNGFTSRYCHCKDIRVQNGQQVKQGEVIGLTGGAQGDKGAGNSRGPHLHFELKRNGTLVDPMDYIGGNFSAAPAASTSQKAVITQSLAKKMIELLRQKDIRDIDIVKYTDKSVSDNSFTYLDLRTQEGFNKYAQICQKYIDVREANQLEITGTMMARAAYENYVTNGSYVPPELALAQLALEGGFSTKPKNQVRPLKYNNPFNIGNIDNPKVNKGYANVYDGIKAYYNQMGRTYLNPKQAKSPADLLNNFVNNSGQRYAKESDYENKLKSLIKSINKTTNNNV